MGHSRRRKTGGRKKGSKNKKTVERAKILAARIAVAAGTACPKATADGADLVTTLRTRADDGFPVAVCEARAPAATRQLIVGDAPAPVLPRLGQEVAA